MKVNTFFKSMIYKEIEPFITFIKSKCENFKQKVDKNHISYIDHLTKSVKNSKEYQTEIESFAIDEKACNLNSILSTLAGQSEIKENIVSTLKQYQKSCSEEGLILIDAPIKQQFQIKIKSLLKKINHDFKVDSKIGKFPIKKLSLIKINSTTWGIQIEKDNQFDSNYCVRVLIEKTNFIVATKHSCMLRLNEYVEDKNINRFAINEDEVKSKDNLKIEIFIWKITDDINTFLKTFKDSIKNELKNLLEAN